MRKITIVIVCCVALMLAGYAGYRSYRVWNNRHLMRLAHEFLAKADLRNVVLCVQSVLRTDPNNLDATRIMAQLADGVHSPGALQWRKRVVELAPQSINDRVNLAQTALAVQDFEVASNALAGVPSTERESAAYRNAAGEVAVAGNRPAEAEADFLKASSLDPQDLVPQVNLAILRLRSTNEAEITQAQSVLGRLASNQTNATLRCQALRELAIDAVRRKRWTLAEELGNRLVRETNAIFADQILQLRVLLENHDPAFKTVLAAREREAAANSSRIYELATWEMANTSPQDALGWLRGLPASTQTNQPTTLMITQCYAASRDWRGLQAWIEKQNWLSQEHLRRAFLCRALREQGLTDAAREQWQQALQSTGAQSQNLEMLLRLAAEWHWAGEEVDLLWQIVNHYPQEQWARRALTQALFFSGQTRMLMQLYQKEVAREPSNLVAKNNLAMVALLLEAKEVNPKDLAREVYEKSPTNSSFAATYAYSLYVQGKSAEALKVMSQINPHDRDHSSIAGYYGLILKATGTSDGAKYLESASKATLLPEERKLFAVKGG